MFKFGGHCHNPGGFEPPMLKGMHKFGHGPWALLGELDLTDEQLEKLAELKIEGIGKFMQGKSYMIGLFQQLGKEITKEQIDKSKIKDIARQVAAKKSEFIDSIADRILAFADVLTFEQRKKLKLAGIKCFLGLEAGPTPEME